MIVNKPRFLFEWIMYNLIGGLLGIFCGFLLFFIVAFVETLLLVYFDYYFLSDYSFVLMVFLFLIPFGLCLGVAQGKKLRVVEIQKRKWGLVTAIGWAIASLVYVIGYIFLPDRPTINEFYWVSTLSVSIGALVVGGFQLTILKNSASKIRLWLLANVISAIAFQFLVLEIWNVLDDFPQHFEWAPILTSIAATVLLPIPTGLVLWKLFGSVSMDRITINDN